MSSGTPRCLVTMAGLGSRFRDAGWTVPKYAIEAHGRTLFSWSMESLRSFIDGGSSFTFVALARDEASAFLTEATRLLGITDWSLVELAGLTDGQASTAMAGLDGLSGLDAGQPLVIYNIDTLVEPDGLPREAMRGDGWIPCFPGMGDAWSFVRTGEGGRAVEVREKTRISEHATVGLYGFGSVARYRDAYERYYADPSRLESGERYVAPLYNQLIADGCNVGVTTLAAGTVHPLGTPAELEAFLAAPAPAL